MESAIPQPLDAGRRLPERILFVAVFLLTYGLNHFLSGGDPAAGSPLSEVLWAVAYAIAFGGIIAEWKTARRLLRASLPLLFIVLLAGVSLLWSEEPAITARRAFGLLGTSALALHFACRLGVRGLLESLAVAISIAAVASVPLILFVPGFGIMQAEYPGAWQGFFAHKNGLGLSMVWGIVTIVTLADRARGFQRVLGVALLILFGVLLIGSQCTTGIAIVVLLAVIFPILSWCRARRSLKPAFFGAFALAAALLTGVSAGLGPDALYSAIGRDATLTGRTDVWGISIEAIGDRPVLGYGYKEFWNPEGSSDRYKQVVGWEPSSSHNGFVEVALDLGLIGEAALALLLLLAVTRAFATFLRGNDRLSAWPLCAVLFVTLANLTEASFAKYQTVSWVCFLAAFFFATDACQRFAALERKRAESASVLAFTSQRSVMS